VLAATAALAFQILPVTSARADDGGFDPRQPCASFLPAADPLDKAVIGQWVSGFVAGISGVIVTTDSDSNDRLIDSLILSCTLEPDASLLKLAKLLNVPEKPAIAPQKFATGSVAEGQALLEQFVRPNTNLAALTASLKPTPEDIRTVYAEPLATALVAAYEQAFAPGAAIAPGDGQREVLSTFTTTFELKNGTGLLDKFPGGYKDILDLFVTDVPISAFKFVRPGETTGRAIDGFIHVNGRWVIMPKPWRALE
jgi:hypothetical protein